MYIFKCFILGLFFLLGMSLNVYSQEKKVELSIQFLSPDTIVEVNFDKEIFIEYVKNIVRKNEDNFGRFSEKKDILVLQTFHKNNEPTIEIFSRPELEKSDELKILNDLKSIKPINSIIVDFSLLYVVEIQGGYPDKNLEYIPSFYPPITKIQNEFKNADFKSKYELIKKWAKDEAIPILAAFETKVDNKFVGVRAVGEILDKTDFNLNQDVIELTDKNTNYWRATLEMVQGNQLIPVSKIFMHTAQGEYDYARLYSDMIHTFSDKQSVPYYLIEELNWRFGFFNKELQEEIQKGIKLHDEEKYDEAIKVYENLLKIYPNSAWANYELYYSKKIKSLRNNEQLENNWDVAKKIIYKCNPLYHMDVEARNGREGYLLFRRQEISDLFKDKQNYGKDIVKYADTALDLEVYGFAAQLYWLIISSLPEKDYMPKDVIAHLLYCLEKLGDKEIRKNFKGDFDNKFKEIEKEREKMMIESSIYNAFKEK